MPVTHVHQQHPAPYYTGNDYNLNNVNGSEPYYQNNNSGSRQRRHQYHQKIVKRPKTHYHEMQFTRSYPLPQPIEIGPQPQAMPIINGFEPGPQLISSSGSGGASSSSSSGVSSNRALISYERRFNFSYALLILSIYCLVMSVIAIAITFIFPFWITITIKPWENALTTQGYVNITNLVNQVSLLAETGEREENGSTVTILPIIKFDLGIWEVKMYQDIDLVDASGRVSNTFPLSMLWLGAESTGMQAFLAKFSQFINLKTANLFTIQILEIMHLIFTVLALAFTAFTLCLCASRKSALCWYLVCFFLSSVSFLNGLAVIVLVLLWQSSLFQDFKFQLTENQYTYKTLGWSFWVAVGAIASIFFAALHTLIYIFIACCIYNRSELDRMRRANGAMMNYGHKRGSADNRKKKNQGSDYDLALENIFLETGSTPPPQDVATSSSAQLIPVQHAAHPHHHHHQQQHQLNYQQQNQLQQIYKTAQLQSPSYIFYKGYGNYEKKVLGPNDELVETQNNYHQLQSTTAPTTLNAAQLQQLQQQQQQHHMQQQQRIANYTLLLQHHHANQGNSELAAAAAAAAINYDNHPYSNVPEHVNK